MRASNFSQGMFVTSAVFNEEALELTYIDDREQTDKVMEIRTMVFPVVQDPDKLNICAQIQDLLQELIARVHAERRQAVNPPEQRLSTRDALRQAASEAREMENQPSLFEGEGTDTAPSS